MDFYLAFSRSARIHFLPALLDSLMSKSKDRAAQYKGKVGRIKRIGAILDCAANK